MDGGAVEPAEVIGDAIERQGDVRSAASIEIDAPTLALVERRLDEARASVGAFFGIAVTGREGAGFLRYGPGGFYRPHFDRADVAAWPGAARRHITAVVFLNSGDFAGGLLRVGDQPIVPEAGMLVAFPADIVHEVTPVRDGVRDTVVDWYG